MMIGKFFDLSNLLKHAFVSGRSSVKGCRAFEHNDAWTSYDPTQSAVFSRVVAALEPALEPAQPDPLGAAWMREQAWLATRAVITSRDWTDCDGDVFCDTIEAAIRAIPDPTPADLLAQALKLPKVRALVEAAQAVLRHERSSFFGPQAAQNSRRSFKGCTKAIRKAIAALVLP